MFKTDKLIYFSQRDNGVSLFEQATDLPYDVAFEFPRNRVRFVNLLGSGEFGEVWLAQAYEINRLNPRDKSKSASEARQKLTSTKNVSKKIDKDLDRGVTIPLVAVKKITGKIPANYWE